MTDLLGPASAPNAVTTRVAEYRTFGNIDTWFKPCSSPASQDGTQLQAPVMNGILAQLRGAIRGNGNLGNGTGPVVPEVNTVDSMLLLSMQLLIARGQPNCGPDTGSADALAVAPATPWPEYKTGSRIWVIKSTAAGPNASAAPTLAVSGLQPVMIVRRDGSALLPGDLPAGVAFAAEFDGTYFRLVSLTWGEIAAVVQSGKWVYGAATGTGNAAAVTLFPSQAPSDGTEILVKWPAANTAAAPTLNVAGAGLKNVVRQGGGQVQAGDLGGYVPLIYDAVLAAWRVNGPVASDLTAATTYFGADTGTVNNVVVNTAAYGNSLQSGRPVMVLIANNNTGPSTLNVNGLGAKPIKRPSGFGLGDPKSNDLRMGQLVVFVYDGQFWQIQSPLPGKQYSYFNQKYAAAGGTMTAADMGSIVQMGVSTTGSYTITLPLQSTTGNGETLTFFHNGNTTNTLQCAGSDRLAFPDGVTGGPSITLTTGDTLEITSTSITGNWIVTGGSIFTRYSPDFARSLNPNGYQKTTGGLIEQWLTVTTNSTSQGTVATLPTSFTSQNFGGIINDTGSSDYTWSIQTNGTGSIIVYAKNGSGALISGATGFAVVIGK